MVLNDDNFNLYAAKYYDAKKAVSIDEFYDDLKRIQYVKRLFKRYNENNDLKVRLILNHLIVLYNCFGTPATPMLFLKLKDYHAYLKPFLIFLNYLPEKVTYNKDIILTSDIPLDEGIVQELRQI